MSSNDDADVGEHVAKGGQGAAAVPILNIPNPGSGNGGEFGSTSTMDEDVGGGGGTGICGGGDEGRSSSSAGKMTLTALLAEGLVEPGEGAMSIDYLGQTFKGDLLSCGKIRSRETGLIFNNPSAWAISCKKIINPSKKSGCGWGSVKYKGRKMDHFKAVWSKNRAMMRSSSSSSSLVSAAESKLHQNGGGRLLPRDDAAAASSVENNVRDPDLDPMARRHAEAPVIWHGQLSARHPMDDLNVLVELETFESVGRLQPFHVSASSSALLVLDLHAHLGPDPVCGYLAGHWDLNAHNLAVTHAFPCMTEEEEEEDAETTMLEIYAAICSKHLSLAGWYRSAPGSRSRALPSLGDSEAQLDHQIKLLGSSDATYTPCVGLIVAPYASGRAESEVEAFWVVPPPENVFPQEYGKPMRMKVARVQDPCLSQEVLEQVKSLVAFHGNRPDPVPFRMPYNSDTLYVTKMGRSLVPKFPRDQDEERLWRFIRALVMGDEGNEDALARRLEAAPPPPAASSGGKRRRRRRKTRDSSVEEEEEIDDDEENALKAATTTTAAAASSSSQEPLDFSSKPRTTSVAEDQSNNRGEVLDDSDEDRLMIQE